MKMELVGRWASTASPKASASRPAGPGSGSVTAAGAGGQLGVRVLELDHLLLDRPALLDQLGLAILGLRLANLDAGVGLFCFELGLTHLARHRRRGARGLFLLDALG